MNIALIDLLSAYLYANRVTLLSALIKEVVTVAYLFVFELNDWYQRYPVSPTNQSAQN